MYTHIIVDTIMKRGLKLPELQDPVMMHKQERKNREGIQAYSKGQKSIKYYDFAGNRKPSNQKIQLIIKSRRKKSDSL